MLRGTGQPLSAKVVGSEDSGAQERNPANLPRWEPHLRALSIARGRPPAAGVSREPKPQGSGAQSFPHGPQRAPWANLNESVQRGASSFMMSPCRPPAG